jgi:RNA polymerase sigma-70 factor (ECF subfamily)
LDERQLIASALAGEGAAQRQLYEQHVDRIFRLAYRMTGDEALAQDLTQDAFLRAFDRLASFRAEARFGTWLHSIAVSVILNRLRKRKRLREREVPVEPERLPEATAASDDALLRVRLGAAVAKLSEPLKVVFVMVQLEGFEHQEVAAILGIPIGTSKARLHRARAKLRHSLADLAPELARQSANGDRV